MKGDEELRRIAIDMKEGRIFHDQMIPARMIQRIMPRIFLPLASFGTDRRRLEEFRAQKARLLFEYYIMAGPEKINGRFPVFKTYSFITDLEWPLFITIMSELEKRERA